MKIIFDIDGVFANFIRAFNKAAISLHATCLPGVDYVPDSWNYDKMLTKEQFAAVMEHMLTIEDLWTNLEPYPENQHEISRWLNTAIHDVYFVTSRFEVPGDYSITTQTRSWIVDHLNLHPEYFSVVVANTAFRKAQFARAVGAEFSIDDKPGNVRKLNGILGHTSYLLDRPYNRHADDLDEFRVMDVAAFLNKIVIDRKFNRA